MATMTTKQTRYRQRRLSQGYKQITLMLPGQALDELDRGFAGRLGSVLPVSHRPFNLLQLILLDWAKERLAPEPELNYGSRCLALL
jgi:hypothetical protein